MTRWTLGATLLAAVMLLGACGGQETADDGASETPTPSPTAPTVTTPDEPDPTGPEPSGEPTEEPTGMDTSTGSITGRLEGDEALEGGCAWVQVEGGGRYEVMWPDGYRMDLARMQLLGPDGEVVARAGDVITVEGRVARDAASICMVGTMYEATAVRVGEG